MCGCTRLLRVYAPFKRHYLRGFSTASSAPPSVPGIPYSKLTVGVPKEIWQEEKRYLKQYFFHTWV